jgi:ABC-type maltose transport system permease subunit
MATVFDPETTAYLKRILNTVFIGLFWMMAQVVFGIFLEYGFIGSKISIANIIFYTILVISLAALVYYFIKIWKVKTNYYDQSP